MISNSTDEYKLLKILTQKNKTIFFLILFAVSSYNIFAQTTSLISDCDDFVSGSDTWPHVLVATTLDDGEASQAAQTYSMNITSLPVNGANVRVYKTTANGSEYLGNPIGLTIGSNSITVSAVAFNRAVKFQFSNGDVEFEALSLNGEDSECATPPPPGPVSFIYDCSDFTSGQSAAWPYILTATTISDGAASQAAQTYTVNVTSLPSNGANVRVYKTVANGNDFFGNPIALSLGSNSITVDAVSFDRAVKFQFSSGNIEFDALSLNGEDSECICSPTLYETDLIVKCDSYTWIDGNTYTASNNTATYTLTNSVGCDSILNLNLIINESSTGTDTHFETESFTWINGVTYTESNNTATYTLTNSNNCDSIITLDLTINSSSNIDIFDNQFEIKLYPNPTNNDIIINFDGIDIVDAVILDIQGKVIKHEVNLNDNDRINLSNFKAGTYFLKILSAKETRKVCFIKN
tara:strand:+ start:6004 stop:7398 length:1395 start_codon:yes stop_codon:yes gene_type:complete